MGDLIKFPIDKALDYLHCDEAIEKATKWFDEWFTKISLCTPPYDWQKEGDFNG